MDAVSAASPWPMICRPFVGEVSFWKMSADDPHGRGTPFLRGSDCRWAGDALPSDDSSDSSAFTRCSMQTPIDGTRTVEEALLLAGRAASEGDQPPPPPRRSPSSTAPSSGDGEVGRSEAAEGAIAGGAVAGSGGEGGDDGSAPPVAISIDSHLAGPILDCLRQRIAQLESGCALLLAALRSTARDRRAARHVRLLPSPLSPSFLAAAPPSYGADQQSLSRADMAAFCEETFCESPEASPAQLAAIVATIAATRRMPQSASPGLLSAVRAWFRKRREVVTLAIRGYLYHAVRAGTHDEAATYRAMLQAIADGSFDFEPLWAGARLPFTARGDEVVAFTAGKVVKFLTLLLDQRRDAP